MKNGNRSVMKFLQSDPRALSLLTLPAVLLFITFVAFPIVSGINISFTNWNGYSQEYSYVGFDNYRKMFTDPQVWTAFRNTLIYGFGSTLVQTILGLAFAMLLVNRFLFRGVARTIIYLPAMVAQLIIGYIWYFIVTYERGALNDIVALFGVDKVDWMSRGFRAVMIIMMINAIAYCGKTMIIFIAGLESIPNMYNEAASIDGANAWQVFRHITMPMLLPAFPIGRKCPPTSSRSMKLRTIPFSYSALKSLSCLSDPTKTSAYLFTDIKTILFYSQNRPNINK